MDGAELPAESGSDLVGVKREHWDTSSLLDQGWQRF